jgi:hypothetical protein
VKPLVHVTFVEGDEKNNPEYMAVVVGVYSDEEGEDMLHRFFRNQRMAAEHLGEKPHFSDASRLAARFVLWAAGGMGMDTVILPYTSDTDFLVRCEWTDGEPLLVVR